MSNRENPCTGHLIEAAKLAVLIPEDQRPTFNERSEDHDFEQAVSMLDQAIPDWRGLSIADFRSGRHRHRRRELEEGVPYAFFDEDDLYEKREKPDLFDFGRQIGEAPTAHSWTIWG